MCYNDEHNCNSIGTKNISISLTELLSYYLNYNSEVKDEIHELMSTKPYLWKTRPLSDKLIYYAGCDVKYLPKVYEKICIKYGEKIYKNVTVEKIMDECKKYLKYLGINKQVKNFNRINLKKGTKLLGLIKNFQHRCVFIQLNIGYIGIVSDANSVNVLKENYNLGDIIEFLITGIENHKKKLYLEISSIKDKANNVIEEEKNKNCDNNINTEKISSKLNLNRKSFFPKSYIIKQKNLNSLNNNSTKINYYKINPKIIPINGIYLNQIVKNSSNGWIFNNENHAYYYEQQNEGHPDDDFYYVINKFQENSQNKYCHQYK